MDEENSLLITLMKKHSHLYDRRDPFYKDSAKKINSWRIVATTCNMSVTDCQIRWKSLRDRYCRERKKLSQWDGTDPIIITPRTAELMKQMQFLENIIFHRRNGHSKEDFLKGHIELLQPESSAMTSTTSAYITSLLLPSESSPVSQLELEKKQTIKIENTEDSSNSLDWKEYIAHEESSGNYSSEKKVEIEIDTNVPIDSDARLNEEKTQPNGKRKKVVDEDIDQTEVETFSATSILNKKKFKSDNMPYKEDELFALSLVETLSRFPPRKKSLIKGEIMLLLSKYDYTELP